MNSDQSDLFFEQEEKAALLERVERNDRESHSRYDSECARLRTRIEELEKMHADSNARAQDEVSKLEAALASAKAECSDVKRALREAENYVEVRD